MSDFDITLSPQAVGAVSALGLAHVGDAVYELLVRTHLCASGGLTAGNLHKQTVAWVAAPAQAAALDTLLPCLTEDELAYYKRGRNAHVHAVPKNATPEQYGKATGLEALFGTLYLLGRHQRVRELFDRIVEARHAL